MNDEAYFWHADKHRSVLQADTVILGVQPYCCNMSRKAWGSEVDILPSNEHEES